MALISYPDADELDPRAREVLDRLPVRINLFSMLANAPAMMAPALGLGRAILTAGELDPVLRELAILATAQRTGTEYEWVQHEAIGRRAGVSDDQLAALAAGECTGPAFDARESLALQLVAGVLDSGTPEAELVTRADAELGRAELLELLLVAGYYAMLGGLMRTVRLDVDAPPERGLARTRPGGRS
jgi:4-carboxymuconolactone decarboxylase